MTSENAPLPDPSAPEVPATPRHTVLVVDDSPIDRHRVGSMIQKFGNWDVTFANNGLEALTVLEGSRPHAVLTDLQMPEMDGLELTETVTKQYPGLPVVLMTAHGSEEIAIQALQKGAASYVPKHSLQSILAETLEQVVIASREAVTQLQILESLTRLESYFELENDTALVAPLVGHLEENLKRLNLCEPAGLMLLGVALHEALTNAILHGNLELDSAMRENEEKKYYQLAQERRGKSPYSERRVHVQATLNRQEAVFIIRDEGKGFDPSTIPDPTDPANLGRVSGRGLLLIQTFMDKVAHNDKGNEITLVKQWTA